MAHKPTQLEAKLYRTFNGQKYRNAGMVVTKGEVNYWREDAKKRGLKFRAVKRKYPGTSSSVWVIYERGGRKRR